VTTPLDVTAAVGKRVPGVVAFGISGNGKHLPSPVRFDALDDVDPGYSFSPAGRILSGQQERQQIEATENENCGQNPELYCGAPRRYQTDNGFHCRLPETASSTLIK
jgi:hypothetical protein